MLRSGLRTVVGDIPHLGALRKGSQRWGSKKQRTVQNVETEPGDYKGQGSRETPTSGEKVTWRMLGKGASSFSGEAIELSVGFGFIKLLVLLRNSTQSSQ